MNDEYTLPVKALAEAKTKELRKQIVVSMIDMLGSDFRDQFRALDKQDPEKVNIGLRMLVLYGVWAYVVADGDPDTMLAIDADRRKKDAEHGK